MCPSHPVLSATVRHKCFATLYVAFSVPIMPFSSLHIPGDTCFSNNFKSSTDRTKLLDGKEAEFYENFSDINELKIQPLVILFTEYCCVKSAVLLHIFRLNVGCLLFLLYTLEQKCPN